MSVDEPVLAAPLEVDPAWPALTDVGYAPIVESGRAYVSLRAGEVRAIDVATGMQRWSFALPAPYPDPRQPYEGALRLSGGAILVRSGGDLFQIDAATGAARDRSPAPALDLLQGVATAGLVVSKVEDAEGCALVAWDVEARQARWRRPVAWSPFSPLRAAGETIAVSDGAHVVALRTVDGAPVWSVRVTDGEEAAPGLFVARSTVLIALGSELRAVALESGAGMWTTKLPMRDCGSLTIESESAWLLQRDALCVVDLHTGNVETRSIDRATIPPCAGRYLPLALSRTHGFACDVTGPAFAFSRHDARVEWTHAARRPRGARTAPIVAGERLFLLDLDGKLEVFARSLRAR